MVDKIRPLKLEDPTTGGSQLDEFPTGANPNEDHVTTRGVVIQDDSSDDETVIVSRDASDNLTFKDAANVLGVTLSDLVGGGLNEAAHRALDTLLHNLDISHNIELTFDADGVPTAALAQQGGNDYREAGSFTFDADGLIAGFVVTQYDTGGAVVSTMTYTVNPTTQEVTAVRTP